MGTASHNLGASRCGPYEYSLGDELRGERATLGKTLLDVQRDLRIKAAYIAGIEDARPEVFPNPGFVSGYVRSYARYLGLDPDEVFHRFCEESGFTTAAAATGARPALGGSAARKAPAGFDFPLARRPLDAVTTIPFGAIGSLAVLLVLVSGLGYGGWLVLQNIQRVEFAPVEVLPVALAEVDPLATPEHAPLEEPELTELEAPVASTDLAELYRQQELEVPIIAPRDGPIAALDPDKIGVLARRDLGPAADFIGPMPVAATSAEVPAALIGSPEAHPSATETAGAAPLLIVAERAAWIRVYQDNGTVLFERILEKGETYSPPEGVTAPLVWAGNSGSVYVRIGDTLRGPLGRGTSAAKDILLEPASLAENFPVVADVPEVISQSFDIVPAGPQPAVAVQ
jgi:cytoskeleton protein RodZ